MRLTFVICSLASGGAQRVLVLLAEGLAKRKHVVSVVTLNGSEEDFFELPRGVKRIAVGLRGFLQTITGMHKLRRMIASTHPDVVISFIDTTNITTLLVTWGLKVAVIVSERTDPALRSIGTIGNKLRQWTYPFASRIVVQTSRAMNYFLPDFQSTLSIIPNPVMVPDLDDRSTLSLPRPTLIAMGRFHYVKGFDLLLNAFACLKDRYPEWHLVILGEGELGPELESLRDKLGLAKQVSFPGRVKNPYPYLREADIFVLSSRVEGFPNALCEAMATGLAVIATDCSGPSEIIRDGIDGILVPSADVFAISKAMERLMSNKEERRSYASASVEILERFEFNKVIKMWEALFVQVLSERESSG